MLLKEMIQLQERCQMSDRVFAQSLGIARTTWTLIRLGRRRLTESIAREVLRSYPELAAVAMAFLVDPEKSERSEGVPR